MPFPIYKQLDSMDCGPTCLRMLTKFYGRNFSLKTLRNICEIEKEGVSLLGISDGAEKIGFRTLGTTLTVSQIKSAGLPCILHWRQNHFVVLYKVKKNAFYIADPDAGMFKLSENEFKANWHGTENNSYGIALLLSPTNAFFEQDEEVENTGQIKYLFKYFTSYKRLFIQLFIGLATGSLLQLIAPLLTQSIVDVGISSRNLNFIYIVITAQVVLIISRVTVDFIRSWILLHISTRINVSILTDFLIKLMKLPISFFETKMTGDVLQRMSDQKRIESFLSGSALNTIFSFFNLVFFSVLLLSYKGSIFLTFFISSIIYVLWISLFLKKRRQLDYKRFNISSKNQSKIVQMITGMQEIKLNNCEQQKRWEWEHLQSKLFNFNVKSLALSQYQQGGGTLITEITYLIITLISAKTVLDGSLTLGGMIAVQYIVGQLNSPIQQSVNFIQSYQDAKISLERLNEIQELSNEESDLIERNPGLPTNKSLRLSNVHFRYPGAGNEPVLQNVTLNIPEGKTTAIVGMSGSGKTTILKLLLRFYDLEKGEFEVGGININNFSFKLWRNNCGVVMQDGFIFSDTIARNIAVNDEYPDVEKLHRAIEIANLKNFTDNLPLGLNTQIGAEGNGISQGQRQRILIARAVYKNPPYIFFDEATNALDAINERVIMDNLKEFFIGRTVVVVAHRLSTVSNADNIIVLDQGRIIEQGTHAELTRTKGAYYTLVKNQLELGN